jgi:hypothetical protein
VDSLKFQGMPKLLLQFDALVTTLPLSEGGEEAQLKRIAELQVWSQLTHHAQIQDSNSFCMN